MACCLAVPSHHQNQCWLILKGVLWNLSPSNIDLETWYLYIQVHCICHTHNMHQSKPLNDQLKPDPIMIDVWTLIVSLTSNSFQYWRMRKDINHGRFRSDLDRKYTQGTNNSIIVLSDDVYIIECLVQDCRISIANALEILQSCCNPSIYHRKYVHEYFVLFVVL